MFRRNLQQCDAGVVARSPFRVEADHGAPVMSREVGKHVVNVLNVYYAHRATLLAQQA